MRRKFSDHDKASIAQQYRDADVTIASLAEQYQVSVSTMQRLLKELFSPEDYGVITASKRNRRKNAPASLDPETLPLLGDPLETRTEDAAIPPLEDPEPSFGQIISYAPPSLDLDLPADPLETPGLSLDEEEPVDPDLAAALQAEFQDHPIVGDPEADLSELEEDEDDDEEEPDPSGDPIDPVDPVSEDVSTLEVFNLDDLDPPAKCYAVIDRFQELATRPLKDFDHAGILPPSLHSFRALPLFDNHRVARRFSDVIRRGSSPGYRVIDFPGEWLFMVRTALWERGITHILFDGHIYDLQPPAYESPANEAFGTIGD